MQAGTLELGLSFLTEAVLKGISFCKSLPAFLSGCFSPPRVDLKVWQSQRLVTKKWKYPSHPVVILVFKAANLELEAPGLFKNWNYPKWLPAVQKVAGLWFGSTTMRSPVVQEHTVQEVQTAHFLLLPCQGCSKMSITASGANMAPVWKGGMGSWIRRLIRICAWGTPVWLKNRWGATTQHEMLLSKFLHSSLVVGNSVLSLHWTDWIIPQTFAWIVCLLVVCFLLQFWITQLLLIWIYVKTSCLLRKPCCVVCIKEWVVPIASLKDWPGINHIDMVAWLLWG